MKQPCELVVWYLLPVFRSEISKILVNKYNLKQKEVAKKIGVTEAAVSQYFSKKRGNDMLIEDPILKAHIRQSAKRIYEGDKSTALIEYCQLCRTFKVTVGIKTLYDNYDAGNYKPTSEVCQGLL